MFLTNEDIVELVEWRRRLHAMPELSGEERGTAAEVGSAIASLGPDRIITGLGGHGIAAVFEGREPGPTVMFRAELDGLPIDEITDLPYRSKTPGHGHMCGHDGHMATLMALARALSRQRPQRGRAVLMFQPAEENGVGAARVVADPKFASLVPDFAFAYHNMPGMALGRVAVKDGPITCASRGMRIVLTGRTAHASMPEAGVSPALCIARLLPAFAALSVGAPPAADFAMTTVTHIEMGERAFGIAPGRAEIWVTLRTLLDSRMDLLRLSAERIVAELAGESGLTFEIAYDNVFSHCRNDPAAVTLLCQALDEEAIVHDAGELPLRGSEDFGGFRKNGTNIAMFLIGAGERRPHLHNPDYDFPDELIAIAAGIFHRLLRNLLG